MRDYSFGNFLRELRERRGLSQFQLGTLVGVSDKAVSKWENGLAKPRSQLLFKLSDALEITVDELLTCKYYPCENKNAKGVFAMKTEVWKKAYQRLIDRYGDGMPVEVLNRFYTEQEKMKDSDIILYFDLVGQICSKLGGSKNIWVKDDIGASLVAHIMGATDVNPLKPHYFCPHCKKIEFVENVRCGWDLPEKNCSCGRKLQRDGHNLAFETLYYVTWKDQHFNLTVSPDMYQSVVEMIHTFFSGNRIVRLNIKDATSDKIFPKRRTFVILDEDRPDLPDEQEISAQEYFESFRKYSTITVHAYKGVEMFQQLEDKTKFPYEDVAFSCPEIIDAIVENQGQGFPMFTMDFLKEKMQDVIPSSFNDLIQMTGLQHGTGVWKENAQLLIQNGMTLEKVLAHRDDVFDYILERLEAKHIFNAGLAAKITEEVRRGIYSRKGFPVARKQQFAELEVEEWFLNSIQKTLYMFPKAHNILLVKYASILMWYKTHYPEDFDEIINNII